MKIEIYTSERKEEWNNFVRNSKNGTFLFHRDFMEYHADRFIDHSLLFYSEDELIGIMPANIDGTIFHTHQGLTYGGLVMSKATTAQEVLDIFSQLITYLKGKGFKQIVYKAIPHIYHNMPAEEDLYALFRYKAVLAHRNLSSTIILSNQLEYSKTRKRGLLKAEKNNINVEKSEDLETFWEILSNNLKERYNTLPVHSLKEIRYLKEKFPQEIQLYAATSVEGEMIAGCLTFEMHSIIHAQYTAGTPEGKENGAIDIVIDHITNLGLSSSKSYFDYGTSTENGGLYLNEGLIYQKEGFGCRGIVYDTYHIQL